MSFIYSEPMPWHEGEQRMHKLTKVEKRENPNSPCLTPGAANMIQRAPLLALGTVDGSGRPWATVLGGQTPVAQPVARSVIGIRTLVDSKTDPVIDILFKGRGDGEVVKEQGAGRMIAGLTIDLEKRQRVKLYGRLVAGALSSIGDVQDKYTSGSAGQVQLVVKIEQSLGNCPKYLNCKRIHPALPEPKLIADTPQQLPQKALDLLRNADLFFISTSDHDKDMDLNHRGGPPGFVRVEQNDETTTIVWPEYSGNNLYQTLGNLQVSPRAGLVFPDFHTGDVLYVTGDTEVLIGKDADATLPRSKLAVKLKVAGARFVENGLAFRGETLERSPYNPTVRYLLSEKEVAAKEEQDSTSVRLIGKEKLTPTIYRFRFTILDPAKAGKWKAGQYAALSFYDELYMGYSHMRDDDPRSLNDDFLRIFTISSHHNAGLPSEEFEITVRNVGNVTHFMSMQNPRCNLELPLRGFMGDFVIEQKENNTTPFIAGGIGITPLLAAIPDLELARLKLFWTLNIKDIGLVHDTFHRFPFLAQSTHLFMTGDPSDLSEEEEEKFVEVKRLASSFSHRRLQAADLSSTEAEKWYLCTSSSLRASVLNWLAGKKAIYEDFSY